LSLKDQGKPEEKKRKELVKRAAMQLYTVRITLLLYLHSSWFSFFVQLVIERSHACRAQGRVISLGHHPA